MEIMEIENTAKTEKFIEVQPGKESATPCCHPKTLHWESHITFFVVI